MNVSLAVKAGILVLALAAGTRLSGVATAQSAPAWDTGKWQYSAVVYGYLPKIDGPMLGVAFHG